MTKQKAVKKKEEVKKAVSTLKNTTFDAKKEVHEILDMIKNVTEILEQHQAIIDKMKGRMGL